MKQLIITFLFVNQLAFSVPAQEFNTGSNTITGHILREKTKEPIYGATIFIPELRLGISTDINGAYRIPDIHTGIYTFEISSVSFKTIVVQVEVAGTVTRDFILTPSANILDEVIISGTSVKTIIKESPVPITTYSNTQWRQSASVNLIDAVAKLPGMSQISTGSALSKPVIRGLGFNRVITIHDGIRQEDNQWGEEHSIQIDEYSIDRYEIIRGSGSLLYGSDGLGGIISILSPKPAEEGTIKGSFLSNYQTNNKLYGLSGMLSGKKNGIEWMGRVSHKNAGNYENVFDGKVYGSNFKELNVSGMAGVQKKWGYSRLYFTRFHQDINIIDGQRDVDGKFTKTVRLNDTTEQAVTVSPTELNGRAINPSNSQNLTNSKISLNNLFNFRNQSSVLVNLAYSENHRKEFGNVFTPGVPDLYFFLQTIYYDVRYNFKVVKGWETTIGTNGMYQFLRNKGQESLYPGYTLFDKGLFVFTKKKIRQWSISGGLRLDRRKLSINKLYVGSSGRFQSSPLNAKEERFTGYENSFMNITGSIGAVYKINQQVFLKANIARGFRAPTVPEIASNGEHAGTFRYETGNRYAKSEVSLQADAGVVWETKEVYTEVSVFLNDINNYTYSQKITGVNGNDSLVDNVPVFRYVQGRGRLWGIETQLTFNPSAARWFSVTGNYSMVMAKNLSAKDDSSRYLPFIPAPRLVTQVKLSAEKIHRVLHNSYMAIEYEYYQRQQRVLLAYNTENFTPAYGLVNVGAGTDIVNKAKKNLFSVYFAANNLLNKTYQNHQSRLKYLDVNTNTGKQGVFNMGRNFSIKIFVPFQFEMK